MKIKENETMPNSEVFVLENGEPIKKNIENILKNKKSVILVYLELTPQFVLQNIYQDI